MSLDYIDLMDLARFMSRGSTCNRLSVGAIITRNRRIISTGYNGNVSGMKHCWHPEVSDADQFALGCETAVHAEANALAFAAKFGLSTDGATLFTTHSPCIDCAKLLINAGIKEVMYGEIYRQSEGGFRLLEEAGIEVGQVNQSRMAGR